MPRVRLLLDLPDLSDVPSTDPDSVIARLLADAARPGGQATTVAVGTGTFTGEVLGVEEVHPTEGLVVNAVSEHDLDSAWEEVHTLAREVLSAEYDDFPNGVTPGALSRIVSSIESVFLVKDGRFATQEERRRIVRGLNVWKRMTPGS